MTETVVQVQNLGKRYVLGRQQDTSGYRTLRESLVEAARTPLRWFGAPANAQRSAVEEEFWALRDVSFEIKRGEVLGIIGRNGAGKSTLLKILSRITEPTEGRITLRGRVASLLEVGTGFHPELTGRENIYLNGAILGMHRAEIKAKFDEIVAFAEVERFLDTPVKRYSSGMYVRLAFAVAAHLEPEILIVDEVLAVGDVEFQKKCLGKMQEVAQGQGRTVFFVSHNMAAIHQLCTRALLLQRGVLVQTGAPMEIIETYLHTAAEEGFTGGKNYDGSNSARLTAAQTYNADGQATNRFTHHDPIYLRLEGAVEHRVAGIGIGVVLKDSRDRVVFRSEQEFPALPPSPDAYPLATRFEAMIPGDLLVPGRYLLTLFIHVPIVRMIFLAEDALVVNIADAGSPLSIYEGKADCGCIFVDCHWQIDLGGQRLAASVSSLHG